jgi:hypothetical protein
MKWLEALKVFNQGKGTWCIARKGTPEYDEVKRIMNSSKPEAVAQRNEERKVKATEQLKEVASASEKRREEAKKKYAEKLAEMEHSKKKEEEGKKQEDKQQKEEATINRLTDFGQSTRHTSPDGQEIGYFFIEKDYNASTGKPKGFVIRHSYYMRGMVGNQWDKYKTLKQVEAYVKKLDGWKQWSRNNPL